MLKNLFKKTKKLCKNPSGRPYLKISCEELKTYIKQGFSNRKMARLLKCSHSTIADRRKLFQI